MQDDISEEEIQSVVKMMVVRATPPPEHFSSISGNGLKRLRDLKLDFLADRLESKGVGPILRGRLIVSDPTIIDNFLDLVGLTNSSDTMLTVAYSSFGTVNIVTAAGHDIIIEPLFGTIMVFEGIPEEASFLQMRVASTIESAFDGLRGPDQLVDSQGRDLHLGVQKLLGVPAMGQVYALPIDQEAPDRFTPEKVSLRSLNDYLIEIHRHRSFEISRIPYIEAEANDGETWGDDWDE